MKKHIILLCLISMSLFTGHAQHITFTPQWTSQSQFAGYYAALENGYYAEVGLDVSIKHPTQSYSSISMIKDGSTDIITCELIQAMMAPDNGLNLVNLLQTTQHSTLVLISRSKDVNELSDLAGSRVGTWKIGFNEIPHMLDEEQHLEIEWVKFMNSLNLYISGAIDATLAKTYNELILFSMSGVKPGTVLKFADYGFDIPEDGLYVSEDFYRKHPQVCRKFAEASRRGWEWVRENKEAALDIVMNYVRKENVSTNRYNQKWMLEAILEVQQDAKGGKPSYVLDRYDFDCLNELLLKYGYISKPVDYDRFMGGDL